MNFRTWLTFMLCVLTVSILSIPCVYPAETTVVYVNPKHIDSLIGQSFTINISITHVTNLNTWQLYLLFNPIILNCTNVWVPPENIFQGHEIFWPTPKINKCWLYTCFLRSDWNIWCRCLWDPLPNIIQVQNSRRHYVKHC